jgi:glycosyltransferase involved in cell wall biosynthesis
VSGSGAHRPAADVSFVLPCLNEVQSLAVCIAAANEAINTLSSRHGLTGEILVADNGSTDGSQALAVRLGAHVVPISERGYGAALRGGFAAAHGRFLVMGDADGSYDFREAVPMVEALMGGADLCMGSRFKGGIAPGAMPWKNRYIGNPLLTGTLNLLFNTGASDAHCGLRALTKVCFQRLALTGSGMEFASEMVIKAALKRQVIAEVPATLSPDLRDRAPHLRPWRDGWRHLRYLFMLSPLWLFAFPALVAVCAGVVILSSATWAAFAGRSHGFIFGNYWVILAAAITGIGHMSALLGVATHLFGVRAGYRIPKPWIARTARWVTLETMLVSGGVVASAGLALLLAVALAWFGRDFGATDSVLPAVIGVLLVSLGVQNVLGGFLLAVLGGNEAQFVYEAPHADEDAKRSPVAETRRLRRAGA